MVRARSKIRIRIKSWYAQISIIHTVRCAGYNGPMYLANHDQTWSLNKQTRNKLITVQRAMEKKMLDLKLKDKIPCSEIRKRTKIIDIIEYTLKQKWKWADHIARLKDNRWTKRCTEWQPRRGKRSRGRPSRRWQDDITEKEGTTWIRKATDRRQ